MIPTLRQSAAGIALAAVLAVVLLLGCGGGGGGGGSGEVGAVTGSVRGRVLPPSSLGAGVSLAGTNRTEIWLEERPDLRTTADADGRFILSGIPAGLASRLVVKFSPLVGTLTYVIRSTSLSPGDPAASLDTGDLTPVAADRNGVVQVRDPWGKVPVGARLTVWGMSSTIEPDGSIRLPALPGNEASASVLIEAPGFSPVRLIFPLFASIAPPVFELMMQPLGIANQPPSIVFDPGNTELAAGAVIPLSAQVSDPDPADRPLLTVKWEHPGGTLIPSGDGRSAAWTTPTEPGLATLSVSVSDPGGLLTMTRVVFAIGGSRQIIPRVASFTPQSAPAGRLVTITGSGFSAGGSVAPIVRFNGIAADLTEWSDGRIVARIPTSADTGPLSVTAGGSTVTAGVFTIADYPVSFSPVYGPPQTIVTITGFGFGDSTATGTVNFGGADAPILSWSDTSIRAMVPRLANSGNVTLGYRDRNRTIGSYTVSAINGLSTVRSLRDTTLTINGTGFGTTKGDGKLVFSPKVAVEPTSWNDTQIQVRIPFAAVTGPVTLTIQGIPIDSPVLELTWANGFTFEKIFAPPRVTSSPKIPGVARLDDGTIFATDQDNGWIWRFDDNGAQTGLYGGAGTGNGQFQRPWGIVPAADGSLWIADSGNARIQKFDPDGNRLDAFGSAGSGPGEFSTPSGLAIDAAGNLYVADAGNHRVQKFNSTGAFQQSFGGSGDRNGQFNQPTGVALAPDGTLYVADTGNHRIQQLAADGTFMSWLGLDDLGNTGWHDGSTDRTAREGSGLLQFSFPGAVQIASDGSLLVADAGNGRIQKIPAGPGQTTAIGENGAGQGQLNQPTALVIGAGDEILVADYGNSRLQRFSLGGAFRGAIVPDTSGRNSQPTRLAVDRVRRLLYVLDTGEGTVNVFSTSGGWIKKIGSPGTGLGQLKNPQGLALDPDGRLVVADTGNARILIFGTDGSLVSTFGSFGTAEGQFRKPLRVTVSSTGAIFVADYDNHRIQVFDATGVFQRAIGTFGSGNGQMNNPIGVAVDGEGTTYVADQGNFRIERFSNDGTFQGWWGADSNGFAGWHATDTALIGASDVGPGRFSLLFDLAVDGDGCVFVIDSAARRMQKFQPTQSVGENGGFLGLIDFDNPVSGIGGDAGGGLFFTDDVLGILQYSSYLR